MEPKSLASVVDLGLLEIIAASAPYLLTMLISQK